jgi:hypothetical protein
LHGPLNDDLEEPASWPLPVTEEENEPTPREEEEDLPSMEQYVRSNIEIIVRTPCILIIILS